MAGSCMAGPAVPGPVPMLSGPGAEAARRHYPEAGMCSQAAWCRAGSLVQGRGRHRPPLLLPPSHPIPSQGQICFAATHTSWSCHSHWTPAWAGQDLELLTVLLLPAAWLAQSCALLHTAVVERGTGPPSLTPAGSIGSEVRGISRAGGLEWKCKALTWAEHQNIRVAQSQRSNRVGERAGCEGDSYNRTCILVSKGSRRSSHFP